jgi:hypothetical protein
MTPKANAADTGTSCISGALRKLELRAVACRTNGYGHSSHRRQAARQATERLKAVPWIISILSVG